MKILFLGATRYSYLLLESLLEHRYSIAAIIGLPRKITISYSPRPVTIYNYADLRPLARRFNVPFLMMNKPISSYREVIEEFSPDLILALGWFFMIPQAVRMIPVKGCVGIHSSLLPRYAGGAPLVWALINGERKTGVTLFYIDKGQDTGDIIAQEEFVIAPRDTIASLYNKATKSSIRILLQYLPKIAGGTAPRIKQDMSKRMVCPQRTPEDGQIDWNQSSEQVYNFIRAQTKPYPGAFSYLNGHKITIWKAQKSAMKTSCRLQPGKICGVQKRSFFATTGSGVIRVTDYEPRDRIRKGQHILKDSSREGLVWA